MRALGGLRIVVAFATTNIEAWFSDIVERIETTPSAITLAARCSAHTTWKFAVGEFATFLEALA
jgi:hypothetical protein